MQTCNIIAHSQFLKKVEMTWADVHFKMVVAVVFIVPFYTHSTMLQYIVAIMDLILTVLCCKHKNVLLK